MGIRDIRVSQVELDHQSTAFGHNETLYCIFTLLDRIPLPSTQSEVQILDAQQRLEVSINSGSFQVQTQNGLRLKAESYSLQNVAYFYRFNPNATINQTEIFFNTTIFLNRTFTETVQQFYETFVYSDGAQAGAIVGGTFVGAITGSLIVLLVIHLMQKKANKSSTGGISFRNISFRFNSKPKQSEIGMVEMDNPTGRAVDSNS